MANDDMRVRNVLHWKEGPFQWWADLFLDDKRVGGIEKPFITAGWKWYTATQQGECSTSDEAAAALLAVVQAQIDATRPGAAGKKE